jgi:hypothetical protein
MRTHDPYAPATVWDNYHEAREDLNPLRSPSCGATNRHPLAARGSGPHAER